MIVLGAAEFSNPLYDTAYPTAGGDDGTRVIANPTYDGVPTGRGVDNGYMEPTSAYAEPTYKSAYSEPASAYSEPAINSAYSEPTYKMSGMEPDVTA